MVGVRGAVVIASVMARWRCPSVACSRLRGRGVSLRQAGRQEQREYEKVEFVDPNSSRSFGRSHPVTKNATAFMNQIDQYDRSGGDSELSTTRKRQYNILYRFHN
eukprot:SAG25_NODE_393_length_8567_cov_15.363368_17_plen_105_part_00